MKPAKVTPVILAGGKGTRLWPLSREDTPKQFCELYEGLSLFQNTVRRVCVSDQFNAPIVVTGAGYVETVQRQLSAISVEAAAIISEPTGKDTSAAVLLAVEIADKDHPYLVMPSDHLIADEARFMMAVDEAVETACLDGLIVTFGIKPSHPETGFGYLRAGTAFYNRPVRRLENFIEKPDLAMAKQLIRQSHVFWNAGIFLFDPKIVREEFETHAPSIFSSVKKAVTFGTWRDEVFAPQANAFNACPAVSFDYSIMEKTDRAATIPVAPKWSDLGSWKAIWETSRRDKAENVVGENCYVENATDCLVRSDGPVVGLAGLTDVVVVATRDAVLVTSRSNPQDVKPLVESMAEANVPAATAHPGEDRPWGRFDSLDTGGNHQVKRIRVDPGQRLSLQYHHHRAEHWVVVSGVATVTVDDDVVDLSVGEQIFIPQGAVHRLDNFTSDTVEIIEVQIGDYLGEDDIVRVEDIYGRTPTPVSSTPVAA
ncbi:MAG: mannose-1-phosphate guanylyltransferase/mannose-6-phosphate isomerase [Pseudomonadota bacterium]